MRRTILVAIGTAFALVSLYQFTAVFGQNQSRPTAKGNDNPTMKIIDLGTLGGTSSEAVDVNGDGVVVGNSVTAQGGSTQAFWWQSSSIVPLDAPDDLLSRAHALSNSGIVAGAVVSGEEASAVSWPALWVDQSFTQLPTTGQAQGVAAAINDDGVAAGHTIGNVINELLIWEAGVLSESLPISEGAALVSAINNPGQIVGLIHDGAGNSAFLLEDGSFTELGTLGGQNSIAHDINDAGQIVGGSEIEDDLATRAFIWEDGVMTGLDNPGNVENASSVALGINNSGAIVGEAQVGDEMHAVLWLEGQVVDLNTLLPSDAEWTLLRTAASINDDNWIAGTGIINGEEHAFLLLPAGPIHDVFLPIIARNKPKPTATPTVTPSPSATPTVKPSPTATPTPSPTPSTTGYDMTRYMIGDGRLYEVRFSDGSQARHQTQTENIRFWHTKGNELLAEWEELWYDRYYIYRGTDTSPGGDRYYTLFENNKKGSKWSPRYWKVGDVFERNPYVVFYTKSNCAILSSGGVRSWLLFEAYFPSFTFQSGITLKEVVQLAWILSPNGQPEERYYYAKDYGLVGWSSRASGFSQISEIHQPGDRPNNTREVIPCLDESLQQSLIYSPELSFKPLPEEYARLVK